MKPNLTPQNVSNIRTLIAFMETLNAPDFTMSRYANQQHGCYTPACALGWSTAVPALQSQGCTKESVFGGMDQPVVAREVFGRYLDLFDSYLQLTITTPQQWAAHARAKLAEWGFDDAPVPPRNDNAAFGKFMARTLEPVTT